MTREGDPKDQGAQAEVGETQLSRPLTHGEFYLAMTERPDPQGLGLRPGLRDLFVGQQRAYGQLYDAITQSPDSTVIVIVGPFGAGKDALFDVVVTDLIEQKRIKGEEAQRMHVDFGLEEDKSFSEHTKRRFSYVDTPKNPQSIKPKVLAINEVAYGWSYNDKERLQRQLAIAGKFLGKEVPIMVLLGDYALEDPEIIGTLGSPHEPIYIRLDSLTPDMLKEALRHRLAYALERLPEEIDMDTLINPEVLTPLVPNTEYPVAVMRSALVYFESIGRQLKPTEEPLTITGELVRKTFSKGWYDRLWDRDSRKQQFILYLIQHIKNHDNGQKLMKAMTSEDMMQACPLGIDLERYKRRVVSVLVSEGTLHRVSAEPDLYLPSPEIFLMAALRSMPLDPQSEEGLIEVERMKEMLPREVRMSRFKENPNYWEAVMEKMRLIYGWDSEFNKGLILEALEKEQDRIKAELEKARRGNTYGKRE
jgi:hypothetical protein